MRKGLRAALREPKVVVAGGFILLLILLAIFAPWIAPKDPLEQDLMLGTLPPASYDGAEPGYWFGTDDLGRDVLSRLIHGTRIALTVAFVAAGTTLGVAMPDMFVQPSPIVNAFTGGVEKPVIVLHSALLERLTDEETLAVIAYKQPVTVPEILEIRGVQSASAIKTLLDKKLIVAKGRKEAVGRPMQYGTSKDFLIQFGLKDLSELPSIEDFEDLTIGI